MAIFGQEVDSIKFYQDQVTGLWRNNPQKALEISLEGLAYANRSQNLRNLAIATRMYGGTFYYMGLYDSALIYNQKAYHIAAEINDSLLMASALSNVGLNYVQMGMYPDALESLLNAYSIKIRSGENYAIGITLNNIGLVYIKLDDHNKAMEYLTLAYQLSEKYNDEDSKLYASNNLGYSYLNQGYLDSAFYQFSHSLDIAGLIESKSWESVANTGLGLVYLAQGKFSLAKPFLDKSIALYTELEDIVGLAGSYYHIGQYYLEKQNLDSAFYFARMAQSTAKKTVSRERKVEALNLLSELHMASNNNDSSLYYKLRAINLKDSLFNSGMARTLANIELKIAQSEANEKLEKQEGVITKKTATNNQLMILVAAILVLFLISTFLFKKQFDLAKQLKDKNNEITNHQKELVAQSNRLKEANEEISLMNENLEILVKERTKVIADQKLKILDYIMYNSHEVRGPLARILGLTKLWDKKAITEAEENEVIKKINLHAQELDDMVKKMNIKLDQEKSKL